MDSPQDDDDQDFGDSLLVEVASTEPWLPSPVPGEKLGGTDGRRFELQVALGTGSMGTVYRAWDAELQRVVALKFLRPRGLPLGSRAGGLLQQEARAIARLNHENIVRLFDVAEWSVEHGGPRVPFLVMEYLEGESLSALLRRGRPELQRALTLMEGIAAGLAHAHRRHLVHRDLKPANVSVTQEGTAKLLDFGLAHLLASALPLPNLPTAGTPAYMSPEQWRGEPQDERTDIWAAGVMLYELLTGTLPFPSRVPDRIRDAVLSPRPMPSLRESNPELPSELEPLVAAALAKDPARRIPSGQELLEELQEVSERLGLRRKQGQARPPERRQVTLVCCVSAGRPESLDSEERDELEAAFHHGCAEFLSRCGGSIMLSMGSQVLACFGYPQVQEGDARNAVQAGMLLTESFPQVLQQQLARRPPPGFAVKVGIHTDRVALRESTGTLEPDAPALAGDAPEVAAWLARQAEPNTVLLTASTRTVVRGAFELEARGSATPEGLPTNRPVAMYRALSKRKARSRFDQRRAAFGLTPLVGRERELRELLGLWEQARRGQGSAVLLRGEAGLGKSRLIHEVRVQVASEESYRLKALCGPQFTASALHPLIELLQRLLQGALPEGLPPSSQRAMEPRLLALGLSSEHVQALASLLSPSSEGQLPFTPERQKSLAFEALGTLLRNLARERPVLAVVENVHWADPSTLEFLAWLLESVRQSRVLLLLSSRSELRYAPLEPPGVRLLELERLSEADSASLVREMTHGQDLEPELVRQLVQRTEGVPLFMEEMTRILLEPRGSQAPSFSIPLSLHEVLLARLDELPPRQKALAQLGAVVGRRFSSALLAALTQQSEASRQRDLEGLVAAGILQPSEPSSRGAEYYFRHSLIQEAAAQSLVRDTRREYHRRIAEVLERQFPEVAESRPELLAHHYTRAGQHASAVRWWARAGAHASQRSAYQEAMGHLNQALKLLRELPDTAQRKGEELQLLLTLGMPLVQVQGYQSPEAERTYARVHVLFDEVGEVLPRLELSYWGPFAFNMARGELVQAHKLAQRLVTLGQRQRHREFLALGHWMEAVVAFTRGQGRAAIEQIERSLENAHFPLEQHRLLARRHWVDPEVAGLAYGSTILSWRGELEQARLWSQEAMELAGRIGHLHTSAFALQHVALGCQYRGDAATTLELSERCLALSSEHHFRLWQGWSALLRSWAMAGLGWGSQGLALMRQGLENWRASGLRSDQNHHNLGMLAEIHLWQRQPRQALEVVNKALAQLGEERFYESALHRLRGESLRALGREQESQVSFQRALEVALAQEAFTFARLAQQRLGPSALTSTPTQVFP
ncbi:protein kinase domain-containing protein [Hyalangium rubrum]|uniref:Protein kinase n=1 Tax=Hyalangium rubrum TaxID=3103134 RepID=A0ABU5HCT9_9BACT|nr:protein kinase [Hyalangium sp. s54d21]MDY7231061.1 protein kinase [Hyalangium sp. s54d21]